MTKIMTIVGTRPEIIKMSRVISQFDKYTEHVLVHTGQNYDYELNEIFFEDMQVRKPDYFLEAVGANAAQTIGRVIEKSDALMAEVNPDAVLLYGDTNSCLAVIAAKRRKIPVFHMEAGNRSFDQRVPEELNRKVVDHLSDVNFVLTEHARRYLLDEGIKGEMIIKTGSHMKEVLDYYELPIRDSLILKKLSLVKNKFLVVSAHREENIDDPLNLKNLLLSLNAIAQKYGMPVIVSTHPRTRKKIEEMEGIKLDERVRFLKPFGFTDYIKLQKYAYCVVSDSGTIFEESSLLGFPAITIRNAHERPEAMDVGTLIMSGLEAKKVIDAIDIVVNQINSGDFRPVKVYDYDIDYPSAKILRAVLSNIDYINRTVWSK